ncbi:uncharacterized protein L969DRAFT_53187 [Mixia osmundae IAM 14324]|uniref:Uncharacterized protein n=1 Tax=Mixia osmundae (strain CBS 9802 / IAM 14324 / JCM 22182 / KY 12970) TaxID=764103 RepID=G7DV05_MIXOS|nr:uncharacterized protein L969DRAFT_53187 [Mixia osmundae IAM 14324]KEI37252.1 hypothetical protein L969DRAFT_53187 [Mixia osmundae IAM 14324]GAA94415.1 hypothetical protein E5Q_01067 [Mixia osmundae IAM 14324]
MSVSSAGYLDDTLKLCEARAKGKAEPTQSLPAIANMILIHKVCGCTGPMGYVKVASRGYLSSNLTNLAGEPYVHPGDALNLFDDTKGTDGNKGPRAKVLVIKNAEDDDYSHLFVLNPHFASRPFLGARIGFAGELNATSSGYAFLVPTTATPRGQTDYASGTGWGESSAIWKVDKDTGAISANIVNPDGSSSNDVAAELRGITNGKPGGQTYVTLSGNIDGFKSAYGTTTEVIPVKLTLEARK